MEIFNSIPAIPVRISNIAEIQFSYFEDILALNEVIAQVANIGFRVNRVEENYSIITTFNYELKKENKPLLKIQIACSFFIDKAIGDNLLVNEGLLLPKEYGKAIVVTTIATARGILYANTKHTEFNKYTIPSLENEIDFSGNILIPLVSE